MPRGNDPSAAAELADRYGDGAGNAEALIEANAARFSQELVAAQLLAIDYEASEELDLEKVGKAADLSDGAVVRSAAVRHGQDDASGGYVTLVYEANGRLGKAALVRDGDKLENPSAEVRSSADVHRAALHADVTARQRAAEAIAEAEAQAAQAKEKALAEAQKEIEKAQADARKIREDAVRDAEKASKAADKGDKGDKAKGGSDAG